MLEDDNLWVHAGVAALEQVVDELVVLSEFSMPTAEDMVEDFFVLVPDECPVVTVDDFVGIGRVGCLEHKSMPDRVRGGDWNTWTLEEREDFVEVDDAPLDDGPEAIIREWRGM